MSKKTAAGGSGDGAARPALTLTRVFEAPRERVWQTWTEPELVKLWQAPEDFTAPVVKIDLRVGGKYLFCMRSPEGRDFWSTGTYREIKKPERTNLTTAGIAAAKAPPKRCL